MNLLNLANEITSLYNRIETLEAENARLKTFEQKYNSLLTDTLQHNEIMSDNMLKLLFGGMNVFRTESADKK